MTNLSARWPFLIALLLPGWAAAQYDGGASLAIASNNVQFMQSTLMQNELARVGQGAYRSQSNARYVPRGAVAATPGAGSASNLRVDADPRVSAQVRSEFLDNIRKRSGDRVAAQVEQTFDRKDVRSAFSEAAGPYGLRADDYGDVFAGYLVLMWMTANRAGLPNLDQVRAVRRQTHGMFARDGVKGTRQQRQMQAEGMMYEVVAMIYARQEAERAGNTAALQDMAANAQTKFLKHGLDLQAMSLNGAGLVRR